MLYRHRYCSSYQLVLMYIYSEKSWYVNCDYSEILFSKLLNYLIRHTPLLIYMNKKCTFSRCDYPWVYWIFSAAYSLLLWSIRHCKVSLSTVQINPMSTNGKGLFFSDLSQSILDVNPCVAFRHFWGWENFALQLPISYKVNSHYKKSWYCSTCPNI